MRSGLTPGGIGPMFAAPSPGTSALFASLNAGGATPNTLDFQRTALSLAAKRDQLGPPAPPMSMLPPAPATQPNDPTTTNGTTGIPSADVKSVAYDNQDNDAANGLYMLAQTRHATPVTSFPPPHAVPKSVPTSEAGGTSSCANGSQQPVPIVTSDTCMPASQVTDAVRPDSAGSGQSHQSPKTATTNRSTASTKKGGNKGRTATRRKGEDQSRAPPAKKAKTSSAQPPMNASTMRAASDDYSDDDMNGKGGNDDAVDANGRKLTDEEKRKNFLERNRYVTAQRFFFFPSFFFGQDTDKFSAGWRLSNVDSARSSGCSHCRAKWSSSVRRMTAWCSRFKPSRTRSTISKHS